MCLIMMGETAAKLNVIPVSDDIIKLSISDKTSHVKKQSLLMFFWTILTSFYRRTFYWGRRCGTSTDGIRAMTGCYSWSGASGCSCCPLEARHHSSPGHGDQEKAQRAACRPRWGNKNGKPKSNHEVQFLLWGKVHTCICDLLVKSTPHLCSTWTTRTDRDKHARDLLEHTANLFWNLDCFTLHSITNVRYF